MLCYMRCAQGWSLAIGLISAWAVACWTKLLFRGISGLLVIGVGVGWFAVGLSDSAYPCRWLMVALVWWDCIFGVPGASRYDSEIRILSSHFSRR